MPLPKPQTAGDKVYNIQLPNLTAATVMYLPILTAGRLNRLAITPTVVTATGAGTVQLAYAPPGSTTFVNITNALLSVPSATAAGAVVAGEVPPGPTTYVQDGGCIRATVGGTATGGGTPVMSVSIGV